MIRLVVMAEGTHPFPYRTRPLSPPAPMVLAPKGAGRVGRCQAATSYEVAISMSHLENWITIDRQGKARHSMLRHAADGCMWLSY